MALYDSQTLPNQRDEKYLSDYSANDRPWDTHRANAQTVGQMYASNPDEFGKLDARIKECSGVLGFSRATDTDTGEIKYKLKTARFCRVRHCPVCSWRRTMRNKARFLTALPKLLEGYPTHRFLFLTLTVKNCDIGDLRATLDDMGKAWKRLLARKEFSKVAGWVRTTEVTNSKSHAGNAHPHFHIMLMVKPSYFSKYYVRQDQWLQAWQESMRDDSITQVDIRAMKGELAIAEVLKYAVKEADLIESADWLFELTRQVRKLRFIATGGLLKNLLKEEMTEREMTAGDQTEPDGASVTMTATWQPSAGRYAAKQNATTENSETERNT